MARRRSSIEKAIDEALEGWIEAGLVIATEWKGAPLFSTRLPAKGVFFDEQAVERVLQFFMLLRQLQGRWAGQEFRLLDWQVRFIIAPVFGVKKKDSGFRAIRTVWVEVPRKNGKSTLCSGIALYLLMADREAGAQVYTAAGDRRQAGLVFGPSRDMAAGSPEIARALGKGLRRHILEHPKTGSILRSLSSDGARQHGLNVSGAIIDEVHVHKKPDLIDALETGTGSRTQPLILFITTADEGTDGSTYATKREYLEGVVSGTIQDPTYYGIVFAADPERSGFNPFSDAAIIEANPGSDVTVSMEYLRSQAEIARQSPAQLNRYLRLHLNIRTKQLTRWLPLESYDATGQTILDEEWSGVTAYGGLDLSTSSDFTAFALVADSAAGNQIARVLVWIPEERMDELEKRCVVPLARWRSEGWIKVTEGNVVDYATVRSDIASEVTRLGCWVNTIGYDPWNATETVQMLGDSGFNMVPIRQGYATLSPPTKNLERLIIGSTPQAPRIRTGGNPVLRWMADCVEVRTDDNGNIKPVKPDRNKSAKRIDGIVALIMAIRERMAVENEESFASDYLLAVINSQDSVEPDKAKTGG